MHLIPTNKRGMTMPILAEGEWGPIPYIIALVVVIAVLVIFAVLFQFVGLYVRALVSGARVSLLDLIGMRLRRVPAVIIVDSRIQASRAGLAMTAAEMESHVLA